MNENSSQITTEEERIQTEIEKYKRKQNNL